MLVLTRRKGQSVHIGGNVVVTVLEVKGDQIRLGISAPADVQVLREELVVGATVVEQPGPTSVSAGGPAER